MCNKASEFKDIDKLFANAEDDYDSIWDRLPVPNATAFDDGYPEDDDDNDRDFIDPPCDDYEDDDEPKPKRKLTPEEIEAIKKEVDNEELPF